MNEHKSIIRVLLVDGHPVVRAGLRTVSELTQEL
jgi:hypothetical protein